MTFGAGQDRSAARVPRLVALGLMSAILIAVFGFLALVAAFFTY